MSNLLDRASVVLTPTAYNNGEALCIKPDDASGDFQFSRNSAATRVNAQGLVENVQSLSSNLVTNGDFNTDTDWTKGTGWSISGGAANCDGTQTSNSDIAQGLTTQSGKSYKITYTISEYTSGSIFVRLNSGNTTTSQSSVGTFTGYLSGENGTQISLRANADFIGSIDNVSVSEVIDNTNLPRINYEGGCGSWLFEPQSTNVITYSELFSDASWNDIDVSLESGYLAPDGTNNAYKVTSTGTQSHLYTGGVGGAIGKHKSIYARTLSGTGTVNLCNHNSDTNALFTITEQWQRFDISHSGIDVFYAVDFRGAGATLSEVIIWGAQMEQQSYATSYIPTEGATVTRNQDVCTNGGSLASINSTEGTLYAEVAALANENVQRILSVSDGTSSNAVQLGFLNNTTDYRFFASIRVGGVNQAFLAYNFGAVAPTFKKCAIKYKQNDFALWIDGVEVATDTSGNTPIGLNELTFTRGDAIQNLFGKTKALAVWKEALSDSELQSLTTI